MPKIIAEIGCNHKGNIQIAKEMIITAAVFCKADVIKFQKRNPKELLKKSEYNSPHPNPENSYGSTYGEHREFLEFSLEQHKKLKQWCEEFGAVYSTSVWDITSAIEIVGLQPEYIKIPSACNLKFDMITYLCKNYFGEIHVSFGMTTYQEEEQIVRFFEEHHRAKDLVIYACTSAYPVAFQDICLYEITRLYEVFSHRVKQIGFSGHHLGIAADIAAMALGATWIERHFTLDRNWKGTDHPASLEPDELRQLVCNIRNVYQALTYKRNEILGVEDYQRKKLKRS